MILSESTKELTSSPTHKGSLSIKQIGEGDALKIQKDVMRPSPTKVNNIADYKLYFTDHETLHADPRKNDMVFVPKKTQVTKNLITNVKQTYKVPDMMIPPSNKYRESFLALAAKSSKPFNISNPSNYMLFQKMTALDKIE